VAKVRSRPLRDPHRRLLEIGLPHRRAEVIDEPQVREQAVPGCRGKPGVDQGLEIEAVGLALELREANLQDPLRRFDVGVGLDPLQEAAGRIVRARDEE
jgi:hypothetical protein